MTHDGHRSRKLRFALLVFLTATTLTLVDKLTGAEWVQVATLALGIYAASNVGERFAARGQGGA